MASPCMREREYSKLNIRRASTKLESDLKRVMGFCTKHKLKTSDVRDRSTGTQDRVPDSHLAKRIVKELSEAGVNLAPKETNAGKATDCHCAGHVFLVDAFPVSLHILSHNCRGSDTEVQS